MKEEFKKYLAMILAVFCTTALSILFFFILFRLEALRSGTKKVLDILMPFIYGAGIAYILKPICNTYERFLEKHWHPKRQQLIGTVSVVGSVVTGLVIIYAVLAMLLPQLAVSISRMARSLPQMVDSISSMVDRLFEGNEIIQNYIMQLSDAGTESISGWLKDSILPYMNMILTGLSDSMINAAGIFMNLFIGLVVQRTVGEQDYRRDPFCGQSFFRIYWRQIAGFSHYRRYMLCGDDGPGAAVCDSDQRDRRCDQYYSVFWTLYRCDTIGHYPVDSQPDVLSDICDFYCDSAAGGRQYHRTEDSGKQYRIIGYLGAFFHSVFRRTLRICRYVDRRACLCSDL